MHIYYSVQVTVSIITTLSEAYVSFAKTFFSISRAQKRFTNNGLWFVLPKMSAQLAVTINNESKLSTLGSYNLREVLFKTKLRWHKN